MTTPYVSPVQDVVVRTVAESWHEANASRYLWPHLPQARVKGLRTNHTGTTTYSVSALDNYLLKTNGRSWRPGDAIPPSRNLGEVTITIDLANEGNEPTTFVIPRDGQRNRLADAEKCTPQHMALLYSRRDQVIYNLLVNNTTFGNGSGGQLSWSGTEPLDEVGTTGDQQPIADIDAQLDDIRFWLKSGDMRLIAIMDRRHATVLARKPDYHGAGAGASGGGSGAGSAGKVGVSAFASVFSDTHGLDATYVMDLPADTVARGQTSAPDYIAATPFLWLGVVSNASYDLRDDTQFGPDGALAFGYEFSPFVDDWIEDGKETHKWMGKDSIQAFSIRGGTFGRCFTGNFT